MSKIKKSFHRQLKRHEMYLTLRSSEDGRIEAHPVLRHLCDASRSPAAIKDDRGRLVYVNNAFRFEYRDERRLLGRRGSEFLADELAKLSDETDEIVLNSKTSISVRYSPRRGHVGEVEVTKIPILLRRKAVGLLLTCQPSQSRKQTLTALAKNLSQIQRQIVMLVSSGLLNKQIAKQLRCSVRAVEQQRSRAMRTLQVKNSSQLILSAFECGIAKASVSLERARSLFSKLDHQENQAMELIVAGHTNKRIASTLDVSTRSVETIRARIRSKTGCTSLAEFVELFFAAGRHLTA